MEFQGHMASFRAACDVVDAASADWFGLPLKSDNSVISGSPLDN